MILRVVTHVRFSSDLQSAASIRDQEHIAAFLQQAVAPGARIVTLSDGEISDPPIGRKGACTNRVRPNRPVLEARVVAAPAFLSL